MAESIHPEHGQESAHEPLGPFDADDLRRPPIPRQRFGGYKREDVDFALDRAARAIDDLLRQVAGLEGELERAQVALEEKSMALAQISERPAELREVEETAGELLLTAHRAAEILLGKSREEAERILGAARAEAGPIVVEAERKRLEYERLRREVESQIHGARLQAEMILDLARSERESQLAAALAETEQRQAALASDHARLTQAMGELRARWGEAPEPEPARLAASTGRLQGVQPPGEPDPPSLAEAERPESAFVDFMPRLRDAQAE